MRAKTASTTPARSAEKSKAKSVTRSISLPVTYWEELDRRRKAVFRNRSNFLCTILAKHFGVEPKG